MESIHNGSEALAIHVSAFCVEGHSNANHPRYIRIGVISLRSQFCAILYERSHWTQNDTHLLIVRIWRLIVQSDPR